MRKYLLFAAVSPVLLMFSLSGIAQNVGDVAPDFSYSDLNGVSYSLSQFEGEVVFIFVFGNGCPFCKEIGHDTETKVNQVYGLRNDFQALGVDTWNSTSTVATVQYFKDYTGITYPLLLMAGSFETLYSTIYDKVIVIGKDGRIKHKTPSGTHTEDDLDNAIAVINQELLASGADDPVREAGAGLAPVFPNPSGIRAGLQFTLRNEDKVSISVFNTLGREVLQPVNEVFPAGTYQREFSVSGLYPGVYVVRMESGGNTWVRKMQVSR